LSYNTGRDKLRRIPVQKVIKILKQMNANQESFIKDSLNIENPQKIELTNIDQSQKVEQTTNERYCPQSTDNLI